jgi:hypothetical protein
VGKRRSSTQFMDRFVVLVASCSAIVWVWVVP